MSRGNQVNLNITFPGPRNDVLHGLYVESLCEGLDQVISLDLSINDVTAGVGGGER